MKKIGAILAVFIFFAVFTAAAYAEREKIIERHNKYGGKTEEYIYTPHDDEYEDDGIRRKVEYYDGHDRVAEVESYYTEEHSEEDGIRKREQYYRNEPFKKAKLRKAEFYYTDKHAKKEGIEKSETYYDDDDERIVKSEFYYTDAYAKKKVTAKLEVFYNHRGEAIKRVYYDKKGRELNTEEKKGKWEAD